jgi:GT2 family glycosyltransferase
MTTVTEYQPRPYDVLIATPGRMFHAEYVKSLVATTELLNDLGISYGFLNKYSSFIPSARELTATDTYHHNWETRTIGSGKYTYRKIFWIDSDIEWSPDDFLHLYNSEQPIISGLYQTSPDGRVAVHYPDSEGRPTAVNKIEFLLHDEPVEVGGVGFGFVAMKYGVFETMERPWFGIRKVQLEGVDFLTNVGEDYSWCRGAQESGFKIYVDPKVKVRHHKETIYEV